MTTAVSVFSTQLDAILAADDTEMGLIDRERMIHTAVERYSHDAPEMITEDVTGDGGRYYPVSGLASWVEGFSQIQSIQYPAKAVSADEIPQWLEPEDWDDNYRDASDVQYILLPNHSPAATETFRVTYSTVYERTSDAYSTPTSDFFAICNLAAHFTCMALATKYARTNDSTINADSVDHGGRSGRFRDMARTFEKSYLEHMDMAHGDSSRERPSGEFVDWNTSPPGNRRYLFHGSR